MTEALPIIKLSDMSGEGIEKEKKPRAVHWFIYGLTIFDIIHIVTSAILFFYVISKDEIDLLETAECLVEIVFSLLLICFIRSMSNHHQSIDKPNVTYLMGYLVASASLLLPLSFALPEYLKGGLPSDNTPATILEIICLTLASLCFLSFFFALFFSEYKKIWLALSLVGLFSMLLLVPHELAMQFFFHESVLPLVISCIRSTAPLFVAPFGILVFLNKKENNNFFK